MLPVLEGDVLTHRSTEGAYNLDSILAYSAVCAAGVDTVPVAGSTSEDVIARIVGDGATLAFKWNKPLATRLLPAPGREVGEPAEFSGACPVLLAGRGNRLTFGALAWYRRTPHLPPARD